MICLISFGDNDNNINYKISFDINEIFNNKEN